MKHLIIALALLITATVFAVGPALPCIMTYCAAADGDQPTGFWFYWRGTNEAYSDSRRLALPLNPTGIDLRKLNLPKGDYYCAISSTNATSESDLSSPDYLWRYHNPNKPTLIQIIMP